MGAEKLLLYLNKSNPNYKSPQDAAGKPVASGLSATDLDKLSLNEYDIVIIGGGTAGCVLAGRLSEREDLSVLLLEAGTTGGKSLFLSRMPSTYPILFHSKYAWDLYTVPQKHAKNREWYQPRGKMVGGCAAVNAMLFQYGSPEDYLEWTDPTSSDPSQTQWAYKNFLHYYTKFEKFNPREDVYPLGTEGLEWRGRSGCVETSYVSNGGPWCVEFAKSCEAIGIKKVADFNTPAGTLGVSKAMTYTLPNSERSTSETGYLTKEVLKRSNLTVVTGAHVTRIIFDDAEVDSKSKKRVVAVEFSDRRKVKGRDRRYVVKVKKEAVLSAGAIHSPHILLHSGIGPTTHLSSLVPPIPTIINLPGVGQGLKDHVIVPTIWRVKSQAKSLSYVKPDTGLINSLKAGVRVGQWMAGKKGPLATNMAEHLAFIRSDDPGLFPASDFPIAVSGGDSTAGPNSPDLEFIPLPLSTKGHGRARVPSGPLATLNVLLLRPTSTGTISLKSSDPFDAPLIDPHYLETQHDIDTLVRGVRLMIKLAKGPSPLSDLIVQDDEKEKDPSRGFDYHLDKASDEEIADVIRERAETIYHPTSTVRMAPLEKGGCLDWNLVVHGAVNLRVVDDSILPNIVSGHTAGPAFALGEKASDLIKDAWPEPDSKSES